MKIQYNLLRILSTLLLTFGSVMHLSLLSVVMLFPGMGPSFASLVFSANFIKRLVNVVSLRLRSFRDGLKKRLRIVDQVVFEFAKIDLSDVFQLKINFALIYHY